MLLFYTFFFYYMSLSSYIENVYMYVTYETHELTPIYQRQCTYQNNTTVSSDVLLNCCRAYEHGYIYCVHCATSNKHYNICPCMFVDLFVRYLLKLIYGKVHTARGRSHTMQLQSSYAWFCCWYNKYGVNNGVRYSLNI